MPAHNIVTRRAAGSRNARAFTCPESRLINAARRAEFVRFIAKRDTCYDTRDTKAIARPPLARGAGGASLAPPPPPDVCLRELAIASRDLGEIHPQAHRGSFISHTGSIVRTMQFSFARCALTRINKSSRLMQIYVYNLSLSLSRSRSLSVSLALPFFSYTRLRLFNILYGFIYSFAFFHSIIIVPAYFPASLPATLLSVV